MNHIISNDLILILGLDDYELIKIDNEVNDTLYDFLRASEKYDGAKLSVIVAISELK